MRKEYAIEVLEKIVNTEFDPEQVPVVHMQLETVEDIYAIIKGQQVKITQLYRTLATLEKFLQEQIKDTEKSAKKAWEKEVEKYDDGAGLEDRPHRDTSSYFDGKGRAFGEVLEAMRHVSDADEHAEWLYFPLEHPYSVSCQMNIICSICKTRFARLPGVHFKYCPNCGAKTDK